MKGKKYKRSETFMKKIYENAFEFRQPYQVLVDAEFCRQLLTCKLVAKEILPTVLGGPVKILASTCVLDELRRLDSVAEDGISGSVFIAKRFEMRTCRHKARMCSTECVEDLVGKDNPFHYVVAVQNYELRKKLRDVLGVPLVFVNRGIILMEDPSKKTLDYAHNLELKKLKPQSYELKTLQKQATPAAADEATAMKKKRKGKKMPNPLAVKKAKKPDALKPAAEVPHKPKRKRKRTKTLTTLDQE